jgi:hypothetical protein
VCICDAPTKVPSTGFLIYVLSDTSGDTSSAFLHGAASSSSHPSWHPFVLNHVY